MARLMFDLPLYLSLGALAACAFGLVVGVLLTVALWATARRTP